MGPFADYCWLVCVIRYWRANVNSFSLNYYLLGNASGIGDGAALCILTTRERAEKEGMEVLGKWVSSSVVGKIIIRPLMFSCLSIPFRC